MLQVTRSVVFLPHHHQLDKSSGSYDGQVAMSILEEMPVLQSTLDSNQILNDFEHEISEQYLGTRITVVSSNQKTSPGAIWDMVSGFLGGQWEQSANPIEEKYHLWTEKFQCRNATKKKPDW